MTAKTLVLVSWGTSLLILSHYINWPFDPHLWPAPPFVPLTNLQPELSVCTQLSHFFGRLDEMLGGSLGAQNKMSSHTSWSLALTQSHYLAWFSTLLPGALVIHCTTVAPAAALLVSCWLSRGEDWGGETTWRGVCGRGGGGTGEGKQALCPACSDSISASVSPCHLGNRSGSGNWFKAFLTGIKWRHLVCMIMYKSVRLSSVSQSPFCNQAGCKSWLCPFCVWQLLHIGEWKEMSSVYFALCLSTNSPCFKG